MYVWQCHIALNWKQFSCHTFCICVTTPHGSELEAVFLSYLLYMYDNSYVEKQKKCAYWTHEVRVNTLLLYWIKNCQVKQKYWYDMKDRYSNSNEEQAYQRHIISIKCLPSFVVCSWAMTMIDSVHKYVFWLHPKVMNYQHKKCDTSAVTFA